MSLDIILFAVVAAVLVSRLRSVLGERHGDERQRGNPFDQVRKESAQKQSQQEEEDNTVVPLNPAMSLPKGEAAHVLEISDDVIKVQGKKAEAVKKGLQDIANADHLFDLHGFLQGARMAFEMITDSFAKGDREGLEPLLAQDLYAAFESAITDREEKEYTSAYELHRIKEARFIDARLGGVMAYVTVDFDIEQTTTLKDKDGKVVEGDPNKISEMHDIWTFARDTRSADPNWELVATRLGDG